MGSMDEKAWATELAARRVLKLDDRALISIKRDVHTLDIDAPARQFAHAFHDTMVSVDTRFGQLEVRRPSERRGQPFVVGDRFQGRFDTHGLLRARVPMLGRALDGPLASRRTDRWLDLISDTQLSDYGLIDQLDLEPSEVDGISTFRLRYRYLDGSPIAGSSSFSVKARGSGCRLTQVFLYQELRLASAALFSVVGVRVHNQVVFEQARQSAERIGARIIASDIPDAYRSLDV